MSKKIKDKYNPNYPSYHEKIDIEKHMYEYPILEKTNNGLLFPEGPKNEIDMEQLDED